MFELGPFYYWATVRSSVSISTVAKEVFCATIYRLSNEWQERKYMLQSSTDDGVAVALETCVLKVSGWKKFWFVKFQDVPNINKFNQALSKMHDTRNY